MCQINQKSKHLSRENKILGFSCLISERRRSILPFQQKRKRAKNRKSFHNINKPHLRKLQIKSLFAWEKPIESRFYLVLKISGGWFIWSNKTWKPNSEIANCAILSAGWIYKIARCLWDDELAFSAGGL